MTWITRAALVGAIAQAGVAAPWLCVVLSSRRLPGAEIPLVLLLAVGLLTTVYVREGLFNGGLAVVNVLLGAFWMIGLISGLVRDGVDARALPTLGVVALCAVNAVLLFRDSGR